MGEDRCMMYVDNTLVDLISDYHSKEPDEIVSYFHSLKDDILQYEPNIVNRHKEMVRVGGPGNKCVTQKLNEENDSRYVWTMRGYYPDTYVPFKMTVILWPKSLRASVCKVSIGDKNKTTSIMSDNIKKYNDRVSEAIILEEDEAVTKGMTLMHKKKDTTGP